MVGELHSRGAWEEVHAPQCDRDYAERMALLSSEEAICYEVKMTEGRGLVSLEVDSGSNRLAHWTPPHVYLDTASELPLIISEHFITSKGSSLKAE